MGDRKRMCKKTAGEMLQRIKKKQSQTKKPHIYTIHWSEKHISLNKGPVSRKIDHYLQHKHMAYLDLQANNLLR